MGVVAFSLCAWRVGGNDSLEIDGKEGWAGAGCGERRGFLAKGGDGTTVSPSRFEEWRNVYCCGGSMILAMDPGEALG